MVDILGRVCDPGAVLGVEGGDVEELLSGCGRGEEGEEDSSEDK